MTMYNFITHKYVKDKYGRLVMFKIRRKADVAVFLNECCSETCGYYFEDDQYDYNFSCNKDKRWSMSCRHKRDRGNVFNPYVTMYVNGKSAHDSMTDLVWKYRKYINQTMFEKE